MIPQSAKQRNMASSFSANQYENAFKPQRLQNWTLPKLSKERPRAMDGHTTFIAKDNGHLLPGMKAKNNTLTFMGTWDLPARIPPARINSTARSQEGQERLKRWGQGRQRRRETVTGVGLRDKACVTENGEEDAAETRLLETEQVTPQPCEAKSSPHLEANPSPPRTASMLRVSSAQRQVEAQPAAEKRLTADLI